MNYNGIPFRPPFKLGWNRTEELGYQKVESQKDRRSRGGYKEDLPAHFHYLPKYLAVSQLFKPELFRIYISYANQTDYSAADAAKSQYRPASPFDNLDSEFTPLSDNG
jgi:maltoporin